MFAVLLSFRFRAFTLPALRSLLDWTPTCYLALVTRWQPAVRLQLASVILDADANLMLSWTPDVLSVGLQTEL